MSRVPKLKLKQRFHVFIKDTNGGVWAFRPIGKDLDGKDRLYIDYLNDSNKLIEDDVPERCYLTEFQMNQVVLRIANKRNRKFWRTALEDTDVDDARVLPLRHTVSVHHVVPKVRAYLVEVK